MSNGVRVAHQSAMKPIASHCTILLAPSKRNGAGNLPAKKLQGNGPQMLFRSSDRDRRRRECLRKKISVTMADYLPEIRS
jgi:hypothetical protein